SNLLTVPPLAKNANPNTLWEPPWFLQKVRALPTIGIVIFTDKPEVRTLMSSLDFNFACPAPIRPRSHVTLAHGGGGSLMHELISQIFYKTFDNPILSVQHDCAAMSMPPGGRLAFTTDSYVVHPLFFPGGDIGKLSVHGTVNDLAMGG